MFRTVIIATVTALLAAPVFAGTSCTTSPQSQWQTTAALKAKLEAKGLTVRKIKTEGGCYETYSVDKNGNNVNAAYNAKSFKQVSNAESGEG
jgi:hypothetical protein